MKVYHIIDWATVYENNRSRTVKDLSWVPVPNKHDGEGYSTIMAHPRAAEIFTAWVLMLQVASRCHPRGTLVRDDGTALTPDALAVKTRAKPEWFEFALNFLQAQPIGWIGCKEVSEPQQLLLGRQEGDTQPPPNRQPSDEEGKGMEGREDNGDAGFPSEVLLWNAQSRLPAVQSMSADRKRFLSARRKDPFFVSNVEAAIKRIAESKFCTGDNDRGWTATFDWLLRPGTVTKVMEGKYNGSSKPSSARRGPNI